MKSFYLGLADKFDALALRERYLVAVALLGGVLLVGWTMIVDPALVRSRVAERAIANQRSQLATLAAQTQALQAPEKNPEALAGAELAELKKRLSALNARFAALGGDLVPPERMAGLLEELLGRKRGLHLLGLRTLPAASVLEPKAAGVEAGAAGLYKHGVEISLEGGYAELTEYLAQLEKSPQKLLWSSVTLSAETYPKLVLTLTVYTLSLDRTWLIV